MEFKDKVVLVTGAAAQIGRATALAFARKGAAVVLVDCDKKKLEDVHREIGPLSPRALAFACDIRDEAQVNVIINKTLNTLVPIDVLVNNAGLWRSHWGAFSQSQSAHWKEKIDVNILGTMYVTRAIINQMIEKGYGRIINLASVAGVYGNPNMVDYSMTKGAIIAFTAALAKEVAPYGITVNAVSPGNVKEKGGRDNLALSHVPRSGLAEENADLICFLASDKAAYISGQNYIIDGCRKSM